MDLKSNPKEPLIRAYQILKFTPEEITEALGDLAGLQQLAAATELLKDLTEEEAKDLTTRFAALPEDEKKKEIEAIAQKRMANGDFKAKAQAAVGKVLADHVVYLKTRGDDTQKAQIAQELTGV